MPKGEVCQQPSSPQPKEQVHLLHQHDISRGSTNMDRPAHDQSQVATKGQQQPRGQPIPFVVVDDREPGSYCFMFTLTLMKHSNSLSVASAIGKKSTPLIRTI